MRNQLPVRSTQFGFPMSTGKCAIASLCCAFSIEPLFAQEVDWPYHGADVYNYAPRRRPDPVQPGSSVRPGIDGLRRPTRRTAVHDVAQRRRTPEGVARRGRPRARARGEPLSAEQSAPGSSGKSLFFTPRLRRMLETSRPHEPCSQTPVPFSIEKVVTGAFLRQHTDMVHTFVAWVRHAGPHA
jgi:hypothetical protein